MSNKSNLLSNDCLSPIEHKCPLSVLFLVTNLPEAGDIVGKSSKISKKKYVFDMGGANK